MAQMSRDVAMTVQYGELRVQIIAESVSWNPDVADDMIRRATDLWRNAIEELAQFGIFEIPDDDDLSEEELAELLKSNVEGEGTTSGE